MVPQMKFLIVIIAVMVAVFFVILRYDPSLIILPYPYFLVGVFLILRPAVTAAFRFPAILIKSAAGAAYFTLIAILDEILGLTLKHWTFPKSQFIGLLPFFGHVIPAEEVIFFFVLTAPAVIAIYETWDDDRE